MKKINNKIWDYAILDSDIIQEMESAKNKDSEFDINWVNIDHGCTSFLMFAIIRNRIELVEYFLEDPNIDVNLRNSICGNTALHISCYTNNIPIKLLLDHRDINVNIQNHSGWTALFPACLNNQIKNVRELLLDARVNTLICDDQGKTARDIALEWKCPGIANMIERTGYTFLLRIPNASLCRDIARMIIEEYV